MSGRSRARDVWVGLVVIAALAGMLALVTMASDGPGFLAPQRTIDVVFKDAQGIRIGSPVRVAGLDTGNVVDVDLVENVDGTLRARVRITLPASLVKKLRDDVKVSIQPSLTGMSHVNVLSTGRSAVGLVTGRPIVGVESSFFDPFIEQVGLGPIERNHLSHTIAEVRQTVDSIGPRLRQMLGSLQETTTNLREMSDSIRPAVESTVAEIDGFARKLSANSPRIEKILVKAEGATGEIHQLLSENRENFGHVVSESRDLLTSVNDVIDKDRAKVERIIEGLDGTRARADRVLYEGGQIANQVSLMLARNQAEIERSVTNVRDATDWANKLIQKVFSNPFVLSPFYKPSHEDLRVQAAFDTAQVFM
jgi:phospholipid/cholesterol/gamma-HCH transport system substrate-binding protein